MNEQEENGLVINALSIRIYQRLRMKGMNIGRMSRGKNGRYENGGGM